ncbi:MAG TPA: NAD(P)-dependent oxidoreductase [Chloroflexota bacterium]|nr:NAD(P)-dependent oxidoreductase [Chloroflexota bacterium]
MKVAVTGAAGRIGRATIRELKDSGHTVWAMDRVLPPEPQRGLTDRALLVDLSDAGSVYGLLPGAEAVIHLGAYPNLAHHPAEHVFVNNTGACANVAAACRALGIRRVAYASSVTIYGLRSQIRSGAVTALPVDETLGAHPENAYALSKWVGEEIFSLAGREWGLQTASLRPTLVIGQDEWRTPRGAPREQSGGLWSHVDARDVALAARLAVEKLDQLGPGNHPFNVNAAVAHARAPLSELIPRTVPELASLASSIEGDAPAISIEKARRLLGYEPRYSWKTEIGE